MEKIVIIGFCIMFCFSFFGQVFGSLLSSQKSILSQGIVNYPESKQPRGELYLWAGFWMTAGDSNAQKITAARDTYNIPIWIDSGNWGSPQLTSTFINYFHAHNVKIVCRLWSNGGSIPLDKILHQMSAQDGGSVDYQMSIGPEVDAFIIDECYQYNASYYKSISNYVHALGKQMFVNCGDYRIIDQTLTYADKISVEFSWWQFTVDDAYDNMRNMYPQKFIGISNDWGYANNPYTAPKTASGERPAYSSPMSKERAVWDVLTGWEGGVYCMQAQPNEYGILPTWWLEYVAGLKDS